MFGYSLGINSTFIANKIVAHSSLLSPTGRRCMSLRKHRTASKSQEFGTYKENTQRTSPQSALVAAALGSAQGRFLKCSLTPRFGFSESLGQLFCMNYLLGSHSLSSILYQALLCLTGTKINGDLRPRKPPCCWGKRGMSQHTSVPYTRR